VSAALRQRLDAMAQPRRPFAGPTGHDRHATWVRPELVGEVTFSEWPEGGSLRHASFKGLREDKAARKSAVHPTMKVSHGSRVIDKSTGLTKLDLVRYYAEVASWALPHLKGRPIFARRAPNGIDSAMVFQEHPQGLPGLRGTDPKLWPGHEPAIAIDTAEDLVTAAQMGVVELHTWNSTVKAIDLPDRMMLDLDPGEGVPWPQVREAALLLKALLQELGLKSWLKTSGGKGLHLAVPIRPEYDHREVKAFSKALVEHLTRTIPQRFVAQSGASKRVGRVFVDYLRNGPSQTTVAAFSARTRPGLGVSITVDWDELESLEGGAQWNIATAPAFLDGRKDPWAGYWRSKQSLRKAMERLEAAA
jgi:bifunctional non-homologous end joining protein LigD